ncbi:MAG: ATP phosphoribosyltransferase regulatory subunit, partial [Chloroflexi bacterium]|nr:ATP phosphoribosyltransferase regulatory subunit [Chloroflexota bacterium]
MKIPRCKGAIDLMPQDMARFSRIKGAFRSCCAAWGYQEVRTPTIEYLHLFTSAGTLSPEMLSRVYSFLDWDGWSGERVVLRPDGTIPTARLYVESLSDRPVSRLCYIENVFSFEGTGQESRERWQCGVELIGGKEPEGDAELIMLALEVMDRLHITPVNVKLSHIGFYKVLLKELGMGGDEREEHLTRLLSGETSFFSAIREEPEDVQRFLKLLGGLRG